MLITPIKFCKFFLPVSTDTECKHQEKTSNKLSKDMFLSEVEAFQERPSNITSQTDFGSTRKSIRMIRKPRHLQEFVCNNTIVNHWCNIVSYKTPLIVIIKLNKCRPIM